LLIAGINYAVMYGVLASLSSLFAVVYPALSTTELGLCFLAIGGGLTAGSLGCGRLIDREYKRFRARWVRRRAEAKVELAGAAFDESEFPIERARLRLLPLFIVPFLACVVAYGWCLQAAVHISGPLILNFFSASARQCTSQR
jgi:hypothetical protein